MRTIEPIRRNIDKYPLQAFILLAFGITWGAKYLYHLVSLSSGLPQFNFSLVAGFGPSISAIILISLSQGKKGLRSILARILDWRVGLGWIFLSLFFEFLLFFSIAFLYWQYHGALPEFSPSAIILNSFSLVSTFTIGLFRWGIAEEIGWRGWMFPRLAARTSPLKASLVYALILSLWHLDPNSFSGITAFREGRYLAGFYPDIMERVMITVPISLVTTYIFLNTRGSLLPMIIFHSASNTSYFWLDETFSICQTGFFKAAFLWSLPLIAIIFSILIIRSKKADAMEAGFRGS